uniref:LptE family protein n=1 Tax=candidate division WOR-3 bacterium TaxID=2052148 RepID=A0A7V3ZV81_UNCW3
MKYLYFIILVIAFCGYSTRIPSHIAYKKIALAFVENKTLKPELEVILTQRLEDYFKSISQIKLVNIEDAELIISVEINNYGKIPAVYDAFQNVTQWQINISCQVKGQKKNTEQIIFNSSINQQVNYRQNEKSEEEAIKEGIEKITAEICRQLFSQW